MYCLKGVQFNVEIDLTSKLIIIRCLYFSTKRKLKLVHVSHTITKKASKLTLDHHI